MFFGVVQAFARTASPVVRECNHIHLLFAKPIMNVVCFAAMLNATKPFIGWNNVRTN